MALYEPQTRVAVNDSVKDVIATNNFKAFLNSLHALYNRSSKNQNELKINAELDDIFKSWQSSGY